MRARTAADKGAALEIGSYGHVALAVHYAAQLPEGYPGYHAAMPTWDKLRDICERSGAQLQHLLEADRLFSGYLENYGAEYEQGRIVPVAVEMPAGDVLVHTSRYDLVAHVEDGLHDGLWIIDHKTVSARGDFEAWNHDGEILGELYSWRLSNLSQLFGAEPLGVCINCLIKTSPASFRRLWLSFAPELIDEFARHRAYWQRLADNCHRTSYWPKSLYGCTARYGRCSLWRHCCSLDNDELESLS